MKVMICHQGGLNKRKEGNYEFIFQNLPLNIKEDDAY
jgi:hypothetical protein